LLDLIGTPITDKGDIAAIMPGKWAAPLAPAMITSIPRLWAFEANSNNLSGVLCADVPVKSSLYSHVLYGPTSVKGQKCDYKI
jgi:hypothetical protein